MDCIIFDFDGTLTDADSHAPELHRAARRQLSQMLRASQAVVDAWWQQAEEELRAAPAWLGWEVDGHLVASIKSDPYLWSNEVCMRIFATRGPQGVARQQLAQWVLQVHVAAYGAVAAPIRSHAAAVLDEMAHRGKHVAVVSNSDPTAVARRLDALGLRARERIAVVGNARKFLIVPPASPSAQFDALPVSMQIDGMPRPVLLRRGRYFDALRAIWERTGTRADCTLVCGDLFEIDLAMPSALGAHVHMVTRPSSLEHERRAVMACAHGSASDDLTVLLEHF